MMFRKLFLTFFATKTDLKNKIKFYGWVDDLTQFYKNIDHVMITSMWEGQHVGCSDAMACGVCPAIHNYLGAKQFYPEKYVLWPSKCIFGHHDRTATFIQRNAFYGPVDVMLCIPLFLGSVQA